MFRERERAYPGKQGVRRTGHTPPAPGSWWRRAPSTRWRRKTPVIRCDKVQLSESILAHHSQHPWGLLLRLGRRWDPREAFLNEATDFGQRLTFLNEASQDCQENYICMSGIWLVPCGRWVESPGRCPVGSGWRDSKAICNICKL